MKSVVSAGSASAADEYHPSPKGELPKAGASAVRGFNNAAFNAKALAVNVSDLEKKFEAGAEITVETLAKAGFSGNKNPKIHGHQKKSHPT